MAVVLSFAHCGFCFGCPYVRVIFMVLRIDLAACVHWKQSAECLTHGLSENGGSSI